MKEAIANFKGLLAAAPDHARAPVVAHRDDGAPFDSRTGDAHVEHLTRLRPGELRPHLP
mgnify:CR=1 FL=1